MQSCFIHYRSSVIHYLTIGSGDIPVVCLHGYGESSQAFNFLEENKNQYQFIAIDLPYHGQTIWNEQEDFTPAHLAAIIESIIKERSFLVLGFSLGARMALHLYQYIAHKISKVILLAPDGLKLNFWYWLATQTAVGILLFRFTIQHIQWFLIFLKILNRFKLVNASIYKFTFHYIKDKKSRDLLYQRWIGLRKFRPNLKEIKKQIVLQKTIVHLLYGKHDRIILPARGEQFRKGIETYCTIEILDCGHQVLHEKNLNEIMQAIQN